MSNSAWCRNQAGFYSLNFLVYIVPHLQEHQQTVCPSQSIRKHLNTAQGTQILILALLFFELQSEPQVAQCETEKFVNWS
jgi:hypothetical protein